MVLDVVSKLWASIQIRPDGLPESGSGFINPLLKAEPNLARWLEHPSSVIIHHDRACCETARLWFLSYARSMEIKAVGAGTHCTIKAPTWLSRLYKWGPSEWPISWCQVVQEKVIDCGVFAALAREVYRAQGVEVHPAQVLLRYNPTCTGHWRYHWDAGKKKYSDTEFFPWIGEQVVYHEICVVEKRRGEASFYDSTWGHWYLPESRVGFNSLIAVRSESPRLLRWGDRWVSCGEWIEV